MRGRTTLARIAVGSVLAGGLALSGAGVALADIAAPQPTMGASMKAADCLDEYREGTRAGYKAGYDFGYNKGYTEGFKKAYGEGYQPELAKPAPNMLQRQGLLEPGPCQKDYEEAFKASYDKGEQKGYQVGYKQGWSEGHAKAKQDSREDSKKKPEEKKPEGGIDLLPGVPK
jgi:flagellar biosynthesis/type III secretory pathway protein FliH